MIFFRTLAKHEALLAIQKYTGWLKEVTNRLLLEPQCTRSIGSSRCTTWYWQSQADLKVFFGCFLQRLSRIKREILAPQHSILVMISGPETIFLDVSILSIYLSILCIPCIYVGILFQVLKVTLHCVSSVSNISSLNSSRHKSIL